MATKPVTHLYVVMYKDLTNVNYELTAAQYDTICKGLIEGKAGVVLPNVGVLMLADIRAVVKQKVEPEAPPVPAADTTLSPDELAWLMQYRDMVESSTKGEWN